MSDTVLKLVPACPKCAISTVFYDLGIPTEMCMLSRPTYDGPLTNLINSAIL